MGRTCVSMGGMNDIAEQLVESLNEYLAFARGRLGNPELAADVVQESLLKALRNADKIREEENVKAWFYRILRHTIIDLYRRRDVQQRGATRLQEELDVPPTTEEERAICGCIARLMPSLKPEYSTVLQKVDMEGEDLGELANTLGTTRSNLTVRLHRARKQLRERVEQTCKVCAAHGCLDCSCDSNNL